MGQSLSREERAQVDRAVDEFAGEIYSVTILEKARSNVITPMEQQQIMGAMKNILKKRVDKVVSAVTKRIDKSIADKVKKMDAQGLVKDVLKSIEGRTEGDKLKQDLKQAQFILRELDNQ